MLTIAFMGPLTTKRSDRAMSEIPAQKSTSGELPRAGKCAFVVWFPYERRPAVLGEKLNCVVYFIPDLIPRGTLRRLLFVFEYLYKSIYTLWVLGRNRPNVVFAQAPPSVCPLVCWCYCKLSGAKLVVDAHNGAFEKPWSYTPLYRTVLRSASVVLVHNHEYRNALRTKHPQFRLHTLSDKVPEFTSNISPSLPNRSKYFMVVTSYSPDEPLVEMLAGIKSYLTAGSKSLSFKLTGSFGKNPQLYSIYKDVDGIEFLGYVENQVYEDLVRNAFGVMTMTTSSMLQQCACMEAVGAGIPLITSDTDTNRRMFGRGAVLVPPDRTKIQQAIPEFCARRVELFDGLRLIRKELDEEWTEQFNSLMRRLTRS